MNSIIIIGTEPPCPRCKLLTQVVSDKVKEFAINAEINHLVYSDAEAGEIAGRSGLVAGTTGTVAKK